MDAASRSIPCFLKTVMLRVGVEKDGPERRIAICPPGGGNPERAMILSG